MSSYFEDCVDLVKRGVTSYIDVLRDIRDSRAYHRSRSVDSFHDDGGPPSKTPFKLWIPLLWGTF